MKVYVLMVCIEELLGGCRWETSEYIKDIYLNKEKAEQVAQELQEKWGNNDYDNKRDYYVEEWEVIE